MKSLNENKLMDIIALVNESIALNESDESLFYGMGIRYRLKSSDKLKQLQNKLADIKK